MIKLPDNMEKQSRDALIYSEIVHEQMNLFLQGIREGNEFQAYEVLKTWDEVGYRGRVSDPLLERQFNLVFLATLIMNVLHEQGVEHYYLDQIYLACLKNIDEMKDTAAARGIAENMIHLFITLRKEKAYQGYSLLVKRVLMIIDFDLSQPLALQDFAVCLNVNSSYLSDLFRRETGVTLTEFVTNRRMTRAADLLITTQSPIKSIAKQVGISDVHYFSRLFKKRMELTPTEYRIWHGFSTIGEEHHEQIKQENLPSKDDRDPRENRIGKNRIPE